MAVVALVASSGGMACDSPMAPDASGPDASGPDVSGHEVTAEECRRPVASFVCPVPGPGTWCCPATFDGSAAGLPACVSLGETIRQGTCGAITVLYRSWGTHSIACYYAASTAELAGAVKVDDVSDLCAQMSDTEIGGEFPTKSDCPTFGFATVSCRAP